jgi:ADP-ribosylglycohydrolase
LFHSESFESGLLAVVNEGGDADTNAAIACSILGAKFGYSAIPNKYIDGIAHVLLDNVADNVYEVVSRGTV